MIDQSASLLWQFAVCHPLPKKPVKRMRLGIAGNTRAFAKLIFRKFGFLLMERQIAAVIALQNCYLLRNIR